MVPAALLSWYGSAEAESSSLRCQPKEPDVPRSGICNSAASVHYRELYPSLGTSVNPPITVGQLSRLLPCSDSLLTSLFML
jgi:hypothetical protein